MLYEVITQELPDEAPAFFFIDIQNDQLDPVLGAAKGQAGA